MTDAEYREVIAERYIRPLMEAGFTNEQANAILLTALKVFTHGLDCEAFEDAVQRITDK